MLSWMRSTRIIRSSSCSVQEHLQESHHVFENIVQMLEHPSGLELWPPLLSLTCEPVANPSHDVFIQVCAGYFVQKDSARHSIDSFSEIQKHPINWLPLITGWNTLPQKEIRFDKQHVSSHGAVLAVTSDSTLFQVFFNTSQNNLTHNFTKHRSETLRPIICRVLLLALFETGTLASFQSARTFPDSQDPSKIVYRGFLITLDGS